MNIDWNFSVSIPHLIMDIVVVAIFLGLMVYVRGIHFKCQNICEYQGEICYQDYICMPSGGMNETNATTGGVFAKELPIQFINTTPNITRLKEINKELRDDYGR